MLTVFFDLYAVRHDSCCVWGTLNILFSIRFCQFSIQAWLVFFLVNVLLCCLFQRFFVKAVSQLHLSASKSILFWPLPAKIEPMMFVMIIGYLIECTNEFHSSNILPSCKYVQLPFSRFLVPATLL